MSAPSASDWGPGTRPNNLGDQERLVPSCTYHHHLHHDKADSPKVSEYPENHSSCQETNDKNKTSHDTKTDIAELAGCNNNKSTAASGGVSDQSPLTTTNCNTSICRGPSKQNQQQDTIRDAKETTNQHHREGYHPESKTRESEDHNSTKNLKDDDDYDPRQSSPSIQTKRSNSTMNDDISDDLKRKKKPRVDVACVQCRNRKTRCDGQQPVCGRCMQRKLPCAFTKKFTRARVSADYVKGLEHQLAILQHTGGDGPPSSTGSVASEGFAGDHTNGNGNSNGHADEHSPNAQYARVHQQEMLTASPQTASSQLTMHQARNPQISQHHVPHVHPTVSPSLHHPSLSMSMTPVPADHELSPHLDSQRQAISIPASLPPPSLAQPQPSSQAMLAHANSHIPASNSVPPPTTTSNHESGPSTDEEEVVADAMGNATSARVSKSQQQDFYGASSAVSFMKLVEAAVNAGKEQRYSPSLPPHLNGASGVSRFKRQGPKPRRANTSGFSSKQYTMVSPNNNGIIDFGREEDWAIPPRRTADHYVQCYFTYVYSLYPFIHQPSFMTAYNAIWSPVEGSGNSGPGADHLFYCIMNIVFAFGCLFSPSLESPSKSTASLVYFDRARDHLNFNLLDNDAASLILLQALLLIGQYLQATEKPAACWNVVGLAIRVAQELGLHREFQICSRPSTIEQEICRRLWHGCVLMDRIVSMTFGRPLMVTQNFRVGMPAFVDDEYIKDEGITNVGLRGDTPSVLAFYKQTILLYEILADILGNFYDAHGSFQEDTDDDTIEVERLKQIVDIDNRLAKWKAGLPQHLKRQPAMIHIGEPSPAGGNSTTAGAGPNGPNARPGSVAASSASNTPEGSLSGSSATTNSRVETIYAPFLRQTNVLESRYLHIQIMLYRPILLPHSSVTDPRRGELRSAMEKTACRMCVAAAVRLIALIYNNKHTPNLPAMWYCMFYVYTSATVLLAAKLQPIMETDLNVEEMAEAWKMALTLLRLFERQHGNTSATRCLRVLEVLHERISRAGHRETKPVFDFLPDIVEPTSEFLDQQDTNLLFTMINDQTGPFDDNTFQYSFGDMGSINF